MGRWTREEESVLVAAVSKYGKGNWRRMIEDPEFSQVLGLRSTKSLNDKWRYMNEKNNVVGVGHNDEVVAYPVDILTSLKESGLLKRLKAERGSEREEDVAELVKLAATKNIVPGNFTEVSVILKNLMQGAISHGNSAVAVKAIQAIGNLARGLRTHYSCISVLMLTFLLRNLEVEEPTVTNALTQTLQAMYEAGCLSLIDIIEDVKRAVKNKVPRVRSLTLNWVTFCLKISNKALILEANKEYLPLCMECLDDGTQEVRDAAFSTLTALNLFSLSCVFTCVTGSCCKFGSLSRGCRSRGCRSRGCRSRGCRSRGCRSRGCRSRGCRSRGCKGSRDLRSLC